MMKGLTIILLSLFVVHILNVEARKKGKQLVILIFLGLFIDAFETVMQRRDITPCNDVLGEESFLFLSVLFLSLAITV